MKPLVVIPSTGNRADMLRRLLASFARWKEAKDYDYLLVLQAYETWPQLDAPWLPSCAAVTSAELIGPHRARQRGLLWEWRSAYIMLDDDQEMLPETSFKQALALASHPLNGLVCIRQASSRRLVEERRAKVSGVEASPFVCTDGGMVLAAHTAEVIRAMPALDYSCDNTEWSLATYMSGLMNLIDHDNWSLHWAGSRGGRRASAGRTDDGWLSKPRVTPDPRYVRYGKMTQKLPDVCKENRVGWTRGFTDAAHAAHHAARRSLWRS
jgi:hypothetical protein